jgi:hypothetical protein
VVSQEKRQITKLVEKASGEFLPIIVAGGDGLSRRVNAECYRPLNKPFNRWDQPWFPTTGGQSRHARISTLRLGDQPAGGN